MPITSPVRISAALAGLGVPEEETWNIARGLEGAGPAAILSVARQFQDQARQNELLSLQREYAPWKNIYNPELDRELSRERLASNEGLRRAYLDLQGELGRGRLANQRYLGELRERGLAGRQAGQLGFQREKLGVTRELGLGALNEKALKRASDATLEREALNLRQRLAQYQGEVAMRGQEMRAQTAEMQEQGKMQRTRETNQIRQQLANIEAETARRRDLYSYDAKRFDTMSRERLGNLDAETRKEIARLQAESRLTVGRERNELMLRQLVLRQKLAEIEDATRRRGQDVQQYLGEMQEQGRGERAAAREKGVEERFRAGERGRSQRAALRMEKMDPLERDSNIRALMKREFRWGDGSVRPPRDYAEAEKLFEAGRMKLLQQQYGEKMRLLEPPPDMAKKTKGRPIQSFSPLAPMLDIPTRNIRGIEEPPGFWRNFIDQGWLY